MNTNRTAPQEPESWVDRYGDYLYRVALSKIRDPDLAEELVQETFLAGLKSYPRFKGKSSLRTWLTAILRHKLIDLLRKRQKESAVMDFSEDDAEQQFNVRGRWQVRPIQWNEDPARLLEQSEFVDIFLRCLAQLPQRLARAFSLREMDGFDTAAICEMLDVTASNLWTILYRARLRLRRCLEVNWFEPQR